MDAMDNVEKSPIGLRERKRQQTLARIAEAGLKLRRHPVYRGGLFSTI
jgi:hypothetical protein